MDIANSANMSQIVPNLASDRFLHKPDSLMHELATTFDGELSSDGVMFDIRSSPLVAATITSLSFHTTANEPCDVTIFTKSGSHEYFELQASAWTLIVNANTQCLGTGVETIVGEDMMSTERMESLKIGMGEERAFYIRVSGAQIIYSETTNFDEIYVEDSHIQILEGTGLTGYFSGYSSPRMWNGVVTYDIKDNWIHSFFEGACKRYIQTESTGSRSNNYGILFDVTSKSLSVISIHGVVVYTDTMNEVIYEIYTIPNGFQYGKGSMIPWSAPVAQGSLMPESSGMLMISGKDFDDISLATGDTQGLYITLRSANLLYHTTTLSVGSTYFQNDDVSVLVGAGVGTYPQAETFYNSRGLYGRLLYTFNDSCDFESIVPYLFVVHYPNDWSATDISEEISFRIKTVFPDLVADDISLIMLEKRYDLTIQDVVTTEDNGNLGSCSTSKAGYRCARITAEITFSHLDGADEGIIEFVLLQNAERVKESLSLGDLDVYYSGDEPLDSRLVLTLSGVPNKRMGLNEIDIFQKTTKRFLKTNAESGDVQILAVQVELQNLVQVVNDSRRLQGETASIDITTVVTGKHRPPSPGLNFDVLIEDSVNSADSAFKEELIQSTTESGIEYFSSVEEIKAVAVGTLAPQQSPSDLTYGNFDVSEKGLGLVASIGIIIGAAIFTFALVFGAFLYRRRRQEQKRFKLHIEADLDDEEDPLFIDIFKSNLMKSEDNVSSKNTFIQKFDEGNVTTRSGTSTSLSDEILGRHNSARDILIDMNVGVGNNNQSSASSNGQSGRGKNLVRHNSGTSRSFSDEILVRHNSARDIIVDVNVGNNNQSTTASNGQLGLRKKLVRYNSAGEMVVDMNDESYIQSTPASNGQSDFGRKDEERVSQHAAPTSQYDSLRNGGNKSLGRRNTLSCASRDEVKDKNNFSRSNSLSTASRPEYDRFNDKKTLGRRNSLITASRPEYDEAKDKNNFSRSNNLASASRPEYDKFKDSKVFDRRRSLSSARRPEYKDNKNFCRRNSSASASRPGYNKFKDNKASDRRRSLSSARRPEYKDNKTFGRRNSLSSASRPEYDRFKDVNGRYPPPRKNPTERTFVNIDLNDGLQGVDHQKTSKQNDDDYSSMMSSSTTSTLSTLGKMPSDPSRRSYS